MNTDQETALRATEEAMRAGLPAPDIRYTDDGLHITLQIDDDTGTKSISLRGESTYESEMLAYIRKNIKFLRPDNEPQLTDKENIILKRNLDYIKSKVDGKAYDAARVFFIEKAMPYAIIRYGNIEHQVYLHNTREELDNIVTSFLDQEYFSPLTIDKA